MSRNNKNGHVLVWEQTGLDEVDRATLQEVRKGIIDKVMPL